MQKTINPIHRKIKSSIVLKNATPTECPITGKKKDRKISDGNGLQLYITANGNKYWRYSYRLNGKQQSIHLGAYPEISLAIARQLHEKLWNLVQVGQDPKLATITHKQKKKEVELEQERKKDLITFEKISLEYMEGCIKKVGLKTIQIRKSLLENDINPIIGDKLIHEISIHDIGKVMKKIEDRNATYQAKRARDLMQSIFDIGIAYDYCSKNPAKNILKVKSLNRHKEKHYSYLEFEELKILWEKMKSENSIVENQTISAMQLMILTGSRGLNIRKARFDQFVNLEGENPEWRIKGNEMKNGQDHVVPLSKQAAQLVQNIKKYNWSDTYLFPGHGKNQNGLGHYAMRICLNRLGYGPQQIHPHGFRSTFSTTCNDAGHSYIVIEKCLAHEVGTKVSRAYNRSDYLDQRRELFQWYADQIEGN